jgi:hypothetical protein
MLTKRTKLAVVASLHNVPREETIEALEYLLQEAKAGNVRGFAFVAMHRGLEFSTGVFGQLLTSKCLARGMVLELYDRVSNK